MTDTLIFPAASLPVLPIVGRADYFPIHRVFCVGRNFADHAAEMGAQVDRSAPFYFTKSAHHVVLAQGTVPMAPRTQAYHHEVELVVALGAQGRDSRTSTAQDLIFAYALGLDMTRRDLQATAKDKGRPWDTAKDVEASALISPLRPVSAFGQVDVGTLSLRVDGEIRQHGNLANMVWSVPEIIADLSSLYTLQPGDLIMMGTPAGVGPVAPGNCLQGYLGEEQMFDLRFS